MAGTQHSTARSTIFARANLETCKPAPTEHTPLNPTRLPSTRACVTLEHAGHPRPCATPASLTHTVQGGTTSSHALCSPLPQVDPTKIQTAYATQGTTGPQEGHARSALQTHGVPADPRAKRTNVLQTLYHFHSQRNRTPASAHQRSMPQTSPQCYCARHALQTLTVRSTEITSSTKQSPALRMPSPPKAGQPKHHALAPQAMRKWRVEMVSAKSALLGKYVCQTETHSLVQSLPHLLQVQRLSQTVNATLGTGASHTAKVACRVSQENTAQAE